MDKEQQIIRKYFYPLANNEESLELKNDAAFLKKNKLVISSDMMIEDQHFTKDNDPEILARKLLRINISDLAAMGATPYGFFLNIALPKKDAMNWIGRFSKGLCSDMQNFEIKLFGGDLSQSSKIFLSMTVLGKIKKHCHDVNFSKIDSDIYVTGNIGDAPLGFKFSKNFYFSKASKKTKNKLINKFQIPEPRLSIGLKLLNKVEFCTDISDGLSRELSQVSNNSNIQANIFLDSIPLSTEVKEILKLNDRNKILEIILNGGEDYELLFSSSRANRKKLNKIKNISKIGFFSKGKGINYYNTDGKKIDFKKSGFSHF